MSECIRQMNCSKRLPPMEVMTFIKQVFVDLNLVKGLKKNQVVEVISKGRTTTWMKSLTIGIISELNPRRSGMLMVPRQYYTDVHCRIKNRSLILELKPHLYPAVPVVLIASASPIYGMPRFQRRTDGSSQGAREKLVTQIISVSLSQLRRVRG